MCLGIPGQVVTVGEDDSAVATVLVSGVERRISLALLDSETVAAGSWVLVHAGFALSHLPDAEARELLALLHEMSEVFAQQVGELPIEAPAD